MFDDFKTTSEAQKIMNGGTGLLSDSQLVVDIINLHDFCDGLDKETTDKVVELYNQYRQDKEKHEYDLNSLNIRCASIEKEFVLIKAEEKIKKELFEAVEAASEDNQNVYIDKFREIYRTVEEEKRELNDDDASALRKAYFSACCNSMDSYICENYPDRIDIFRQYLADPSLCYPDEYDKDELHYMVDNNGISAGILFTICLKAVADIPLDTYAASHLSHIQNDIMEEALQIISAEMDEVENPKESESTSAELVDKSYHISKKDEVNTETSIGIKDNQKEVSSVKQQDKREIADNEEDDDEYTDLLSKHMYLRMMAEQKLAKTKKYVVVLIVLLIGSIGFGVYEFISNQAAVEQLKEEYEVQESDLELEKDQILYNAEEHLDYYSETFAFVTDPQTVYYHRHGCPELDTKKVYYNTIDNWKLQGKVKCTYCYGKKFSWEEILTE